MPDLDQIKDEKLTGNDSEVSGEMFREPRYNDYEHGNIETVDHLLHSDSRSSGIYSQVSK